MGSRRSQSQNKQSLIESVKRKYCSFCIKVTEDIEEHQKRYHFQHLFKCKICNFCSTTRGVIIDHLKSNHKLVQTDEYKLLKYETIIPKDIRRIFCSLCENSEWLCQAIIDVEKQLRKHMEEFHKGEKLLADIIRLGCRLCQDKFHFDIQSRNAWKIHVEFQHRHRKQRISSFHHYPHREEHRFCKQLKLEDRINCGYCFKVFASGEKETDHIKKLHLKESFSCSLCSELDPTPFYCRQDLTEHVDMEHQGDSRNTKGIRENFISYPKDLRCMHCYLCGKNFFSVGVEEMKIHFVESHKDSSGFDPGQLDYRCRICMAPGVHDDEEELLDHMKQKHPSQLNK